MQLGERRPRLLARILAKLSRTDKWHAEDVYSGLQVIPGDVCSCAELLSERALRRDKCGPAAYAAE